MEASRKQQDLEQLKQLTAQHQVVGWASNVWLNGLISRYPCHYLLFTQNKLGNEYRKGIATRQVIDLIESRINKLLELPLQGDDVEQFEALIEMLDYFIAKRST
jgi:hypothetical protein